MKDHTMREANEVFETLGEAHKTMIAAPDGESHVAAMRVFTERLAAARSIADAGEGVVYTVLRDLCNYAEREAILHCMTRYTTVAVALVS